METIRAAMFTLTSNETTKKERERERERQKKMRERRRRKDYSLPIVLANSERIVRFLLMHRTQCQ
jgi:hypothetical protein